MDFLGGFQNFTERLQGRKKVRGGGIDYDHLLTILVSIGAEEESQKISLKAEFDYSHYGYLFQIQRATNMGDVLKYVNIFRPQEEPKVNPEVKIKQYAGKNNTKYVLSFKKTDVLKGNLEILVSSKKKS